VSRPAVSIVVPTHNRPASLKRCLASVQPQLDDRDELIVVDSGSDDATYAEDLAAAVDARHVRLDHAGASLARNVGWQSARHDIVVFVDDDVTAEPEWLMPLVVRFAFDDRLGFVAGRMEAAGTMRPISVRVGNRPGTLSLGHPSPGATGNVAIRRTALEDVAGFDERLGPGAWLAAAEDLDLLDRILAAGWSGWYAPQAVVYGEQPSTRRDQIRRTWAYGKGSGGRLAKTARRDPIAAARLARMVLPALRRSRSLSPDDPDAVVLPRDPVLSATRTAGTVIGFAAGLVMLRPRRR